MAQRKKSKNKARPAAARVDGLAGRVAGDSLEAVREILFGRERRTARERAEAIESNLADEIRDLRQELRARAAKLDKEVAAAKRRHKSLMTRVARLAEAIDTELAATRKRFDAQMRELADELDAGFADWQRSHIDRARLAAVLASAAKRIAPRTKKQKA